MKKFKDLPLRKIGAGGNLDMEIITDEQIKEYKEKKCGECDFANTSYCAVTNNDVRLCISIDEPIPEL